VAADERYRKLLGIEPSGETPTHYELLVLDRTVTDAVQIEESYKSQMKKLQSVKTSKDKGFLEFLKEELRAARLTLTNAERRKAYDESLAADAIVMFKQFVQPLMAMGTVPKSVFDTMVSKGVHDGLTPDQASNVIKELAKASNATLQLDAPAPAAPSRLAPPRTLQPEPEDDPSATHADTFDLPESDHFVDDSDIDEVSYSDEYTGSHQEEEEVVTAEAVEDDPSFADEAGTTAPARGAVRPPPSFRQETVLRAPPGAPAGPRPPSGPPAPAEGGSKIQRGRFYDFAGGEAPAAEPPKPASPWARGGSSSSGAGGRPPSAWGRSDAAPQHPAPGRPPDTAQNQRERFVGQEGLRAISDARRSHNAGAKLARIANDLHEQLAQYFPPTNGRSTIVYQINGVSFEKVFDSEQKTYRDALKKFEEALQKVEGITSPPADEVRGRSNQCVGLIKGYLEEIRQQKLKRLAPMSKPEELRMWQTFVSSKRSSRLAQTLDDR
jgi:hypothetical protein